MKEISGAGGGLRACQVVVALAATMALCHTPGAVAQEESLRPVVVAPVQVTAATETVSLPGTVRAARSSRLSSAIGGLVRSVAVDVGTPVAAGEVIVELDDALARHALARAGAAVQEAVADATEKNRLLRIGRNLARRGVLTDDQISTRRANAQMAQAVVTRLQAEEAAATETLNRHQVRAPFDGVIAEKLVESGEWVSPGTAVAHLVSGQPVHVDVAVPQGYLSRVNDNTQYALSFAALPGQAVAARRVAVSPVSNPVSRTFLLRLAPTGQQGPIVPGMSAQAELTFTTPREVMVVSRDAVIRHVDGGTTVWVVQSAADNGAVRVVEKPVQLGQPVDDQVVVTSGLSATDRVVVTGNESLRSGQQVRISNAPGKAS